MRTAALLALPCAVLALSTGPSSAQSPTANECHALADAMQRLACYDRATGRAPAPAEAPKPLAAEPATSPAPEASSQGASLLDASWGLTPGSDRYPLKFHNANYFLFARYSDDVNNKPFTPVFNAAGIPDQSLDATEVKFQFSGKLRVWTDDERRWGFWLAYTQQSHWQVYNEDVSRPFRETNYMPELFVSFNPDVRWGDWRWAYASLGYVHQSNGRADPLSRSWDRIFAQFGVENGNLALYLKLWSRLSESADKDDNPDITDYYGYGQIDAIYRWRGHSFTGSLRGNIGEAKGAVQLGWFSPALFGPVRGYVQLFSGYGESMIDYNWRQTTIGIGIALSDGL
jgi:phospholipase A1